MASIDRRRSGLAIGPLDLDEPQRARRPPPTVEAVPGLEIVQRGTRLGGRVIGFAHGTVTFCDTRGVERKVRARPGAFTVGGEPVTLVAPRSPSVAPSRTASGSIPVRGARARVARAGRILVEGVHDAELVEKVWGDDLRVEGVVVERLDGADHLEQVVGDFRPGPDRRLGVLLDHVVDGSKESRLGRAVTDRSPHVLVTGHPFVDIWAAVRPGVVGIDAWPEIPRGTPWKEGVCRALGVSDPRVLWRQILGSVQTYADLEAPLVGAVERLIDFVTGER